MEDGRTTAVLVFPDSMTEDEALVQVEMSEREMAKLGEIHNGREGVRACQYHVSGAGNGARG